MKPPIDSFIEWFMSLPVSHREDVATYAILCIPGYGDLDMLNLANVEEQFLGYLQIYAEDRLKGVGVILSLRALVEFFFIESRGSRAGWSEAESNLAGAKAFFEKRGLGDMVQSADRFLKEIPFKSRQWIATADKWKILRDSDLSDENINAWWKS